MLMFVFHGASHEYACCGAFAIVFYAIFFAISSGWERSLTRNPPLVPSPGLSA